MNEIISFAIGLVIAIVTAIINKIKNRLDEKTRAKIADIAAVVENLYDGVASGDKLKAFRDICAAKNINVEKAVKYLEDVLIPASKDLNRYVVGTITKHDKNTPTD